jgi:hypothetical protein
MTYSGGRIDASGTADDEGLYYGGFTDNGGSSGWYWACGPGIGTVFYSVNSLNYFSTEDVEAADNANRIITITVENLSNEPTIQNHIMKIALRRGNFRTYENMARSSPGTTYAMIIRIRAAMVGKGYFVEYGNLAIADNGSGMTRLSPLTAVHLIMSTTSPTTLMADKPATLPQATPTAPVHPSDADEAGYTFGGWYADSGFSGSSVASIGTADTAT